MLDVLGVFFSLLVSKLIEDVFDSVPMRKRKTDQFQFF